MEFFRKHIRLTVVCLVLLDLVLYNAWNITGDVKLQWYINDVGVAITIAGWIFFAVLVVNEKAAKRILEVWLAFAVGVVFKELFGLRSGTLEYILCGLYALWSWWRWHRNKKQKQII